MSNTNAAEIAAKNYTKKTFKRASITEAIAIEQIYVDGYTAALSNGLKWRRIDLDNIPPDDAYFVRQKAHITKGHMGKVEHWKQFTSEGYTHYLSENQLLTKIPIE